MSTEPRAYLVSSRVAASSTASLMAIPSEPGLSGVSAEDLAAVVRRQRRARDDLRAVGLHEDPPVRLLVVAGANHVDLDLEPEQGAGERQGAPPLAGAGLGGEALHALLLVVQGLRDGGVRLVAAGRADALVLVVDVGRRIERALEAMGAVQRARPIEPVGVADGLGDLDLALGRDLLADERHREQRREVVRADRLAACPGGAAASGGTGRSAAMLYQARGIRDSSRTNFVCRGSEGAIWEPPAVAGVTGRDGSLAPATSPTQPLRARRPAAVPASSGRTRMTPLLPLPSPLPLPLPPEHGRVARRALVVARRCGPDRRTRRTLTFGPAWAAWASGSAVASASASASGCWSTGSGVGFGVGSGRSGRGSTRGGSARAWFGRRVRRSAAAGRPPALGATAGAGGRGAARRCAAGVVARRSASRSARGEMVGLGSIDGVERRRSGAHGRRWLGRVPRGGEVATPVSSGCGRGGR